MRSLSSKQARAKAISTTVKMLVYHRDGGLCIRCHRPGNPEAHFISRSKGGLGVPENILTLCRECHDAYDFGTREQREGMREEFREYLMSKYPHWDETQLTYRKWRAE